MPARLPFPPVPAAARGPLFMVLATASYVVNDSMMKLATVGLPPYEVLFLRGCFATLWSAPLVVALGLGRQIHRAFGPAALLRNGFELAAIASFIVALANMPIADATALGQVTPLLVLLGASVFFGERLGWRKGALAGLGFAGAMLIAQPTPQGVTVYAAAGLANACFSAARDLASRRVGADVPGVAVAFGATVIVLAGAGLAHLLFEDWVAPGSRHLLLLFGAGLFLFGGHFCIFMAYRIGPAGAVAPFYYFFTVWSVISGLVVFREWPNPLALAGIALVAGSGLAVTLADRKPTKIAPVA